MPRLTVRPEGELDALDAAAWYDAEPTGLGTEFLTELRGTFSRIEDGPQRFIVEAESAVVLAITHLRRHPSVWQRRA